MAEVQNQSSWTAASSPPLANTADRLVPEPHRRVDLEGSGGGGGGVINAEANSGYADCDARHVVSLSEYNVCVQMGGHASIAQQSQGEHERVFGMDQHQPMYTYILITRYKIDSFCNARYVALQYNISAGDAASYNRSSGAFGGRNGDERARSTAHK